MALQKPEVAREMILVKKLRISKENGSMEDPHQVVVALARLKGKLISMSTLVIDLLSLTSFFSKKHHPLQNGRRKRKRL